MNINDAFPSKFLKADDLAGQRIAVTVMACTMEDIGDKEFKPVLRFMNKDKGMVLNKTNAFILSSTWGDETDRWTGQRLELFAQPVQFQGRQVMGLAVAPLLAPSGPAAKLEQVAADVQALEQANNPPGPGHADPADFDDVPF